MSRLLIGAALVALLLASFLGWRWNVRRSRRRESVRDQLVRLAHERADHAAVQDPAVLDPGPVEQQVAVVLNSYVLDDPYLADGFARLDQAIRDQHTNTTEGE